MRTYNGGDLRLRFFSIELQLRRLQELHVDRFWGQEWHLIFRHQSYFLLLI